MRPAGPWQKPAHHSFVWFASAWLKFVLLDCLPRKIGCLLWRLPFILRQRHPLANDLPPRFVIYHFASFDDLQVDGVLVQWFVLRTTDGTLQSSIELTTCRVGVVL